MRKTEEQIIRDVYTILVLNQGKAITRAELATLAHTSDRSARHAIEELRKRGEPIGQAPGKGYSYGVQGDVDKAIKDYYSKAMSNLRIARALEGRPIDGQESVNVLRDI